MLYTLNQTVKLGMVAHELADQAGHLLECDPFRRNEPTEDTGVITIGHRLPPFLVASLGLLGDCPEWIIR